MLKDFEKYETFVSKKYPQFVAALVTAIGSLALGTVVGWSSPAFTTIRETEHFANITDDELTWVASLVPLGAISATPIAAYSLQNIGRQRSLFFLCFPLIASWLIIALAQNVVMLYIGRLITGMCTGSVLSLIPIYVSEVCEKSIRGVASVPFACFCGLGIMFTYILGYFVSWETLSFLCTGIPVMYLVGLYFIPESPTYLLIKGKKKLAGKSLMWLRGADSLEKVEEELNMLYEELNSLKSPEDSSGNVQTKDFFSYSTLKPVTIVLLLMIFQQLSGINIVIFYSSKLFESAGADLDPNISSIILSVLMFLTVAISTGLVDKAGRKSLFVLSCLGSGISSIGLGTYFYIKHSNGDEVPEGMGWLPLTSLVGFVIAFNIGLGPIPFIYMGEALPPHVKASTSALAISLNWMLAFAVTNSFESVSQWIGTYGCYWFLGGITLVGAIFAVIFVPETKGKSLTEIQNLFVKKRSDSLDKKSNVKFLSISQKTIN